jgi:hypothetical protein
MRPSSLIKLVDPIRVASLVPYVASRWRRPPLAQHSVPEASAHEAAGSRAGNPSVPSWCDFNSDPLDCSAIWSIQKTSEA